jgi:hypothetical protein
VDLVIPRSKDLLDFEKKLIEIMISEKCTMSEAIGNAFSSNGIDQTNLFDMVDFLEEQVYDLDKVQAMMMIYNGQISDFHLVRLIEDGKAKNKEPNKD